MPTLQEEKAVADIEGTNDGADLKTNLPQNYRRLEWLMPTLLCAVMLGLVLLTSSQLSQTADEATHLYSGYRYLKCGDFTVSPEHPPLAKIVAAAPLLPMNLAVDCAPFQGDAEHQAFASLNWLYTQNWPAALARARAAAAVFAVGLCLLVWITARRMFDFATATAASLLLVFEPNVLAFGSLVLTDVPVACMLLFAVLGFYLWTKHRSIPFFLLTVLATGLTLLAKQSGVAVVPILGVLAVTDALTQANGLKTKFRLATRNLVAVCLICALAAGIVWVGYGMRFSIYPGAMPIQQLQIPVTSVSDRLLMKVEKYHLLPQGYLEGFAAARILSREGSSVTFVAGKIYQRAPWFATPFNFLIRSTGATVVIILLAVFGWLIAFGRRTRERLFLLTPAAVYVAVCFHASGNVNIRYLLPMVPFLMIVVAEGSVTLARRARWANYALPCLIVLHAASSLHAFPNYLSYTNDLWGGPTQAYRYLPWLDLGQAYPEAKSYLERHPVESCWFIAAWQWDPKLYDVPCQSFSLYLAHEIPPHLHGTIIVSSTLVNGVRLADMEMAAAFKKAVPKDRIGGSALLVYEGDFDTSLNAAGGESGLAMKAFLIGDLPAALEHGKKAMALAPASPLVHLNLCSFLSPTQVDAALKECYLARDLLQSDPLRQEQSRKEHLESLQRAISALENNYLIIHGREPDSKESAEISRR